MITSSSHAVLAEALSAKVLQGSLLFFRLASNAFPDFGSVGRVKKMYKKNHKKSENRGPETSASLLWSLETTIHGHQIATNSIWSVASSGYLPRR